MAPRPVVIRTLDIGGDKSLRALNLPHEDNPYLGWRGVRLWLDRKDLAVPQLRALLRAARHGAIEILLPMIADIGELRRARALVERVRSALGDAAGACRLGIMIEVPSAALVAEQLAAECDFFSIGTNDLTQYTLAADRGNPRTAQRYDALHPAVLRLVDMTIQGARKHGRPVAVCGDLAADPRAIPTLVALGVDQLSVPAAAIAATKQRIRLLNRADDR
jgi:phosphoenolpyruvate-protein kinase (PTS system EI component)